MSTRSGVGSISPAPEMSTRSGVGSVLAGQVEDRPDPPRFAIPRLTQMLFACRLAGRTIRPRCPRADRGRQVARRPGLSRFSREDTEGAATERSSGAPCIRTRFWSAPTAVRSSSSPPASRISTPSAVLPSQSDAAHAAPLARLHGLRAAVRADSVVDTTAGRARCSPRRAAVAESRPRFRSGLPTASPSIAATASELRAATDQPSDIHWGDRGAVLRSPFSIDRLPFSRPPFGSAFIGLHRPSELRGTIRR